MEDEHKEYALKALERINHILESNQLDTHHEPEGTEEDEYWNFMIKYGAVEEFQDLVRKLKKQGDLSFSDATLSHLLEHSASDGFFLPMDFESILFDDDYHLSSCVKIREICAEVARYLELPTPLDELSIDYSGEGEEIEDLLDENRKEGGKWTECFIETLICVVLYQGATVSLNTGKIMVFA